MDWDALMGHCGCPVPQALPVLAGNDVSKAQMLMLAQRPGVALYGVHTPPARRLIL